MADLYLHIGSNKTATTTLQHCFAKSCEVLAKAGVLYPRAGQSAVGAHHVLGGHLCRRPPSVFQPKGALVALLQKLREEVSAAETSAAPLRVVLSSEMLYLIKRNDRKALVALFSEFAAVKVIVYLRRQDSYLPSFYSSRVNNGECPPPFERFCAETNLDYLVNLDAWSEFVGPENIIARPFVREHWVGGNIVRDFLAHIGSDLTPETLAHSEPRNRALSAEVIEVLLAAGGGKSIARFAEFQEFLGEHFAAERATPSSQLMTQSVLDTLSRRYDASNRELGSRDFASAEATALGFSADETATAVAEPILAPADYAKLLRVLWDDRLQAQKRIANQQRRLRGRRDTLREMQSCLDEQARQLREQAAIAKLREEAIGLYRLREAYLSQGAARLRPLSVQALVRGIGGAHARLLNDLVSEDLAAIDREIERLSTNASGGKAAPWAPSGSTALIEGRAQGRVTARLLARVLISRYTDRLSWRQQSQLVWRAAVAQAQSGFADWIGRLGVALMPLFQHLKVQLLEGERLHARAAAVPMVSLDGKLHSATIWAYVTADPARIRTVVYEFRPSGRGAAGGDFLAGWAGELLPDGDRLPRDTAAQASAAPAVGSTLGRMRLRLPRRHANRDPGQAIENCLWPGVGFCKRGVFAVSPRGGQRAAAVLSLIQTARVNGLDPQAYLELVIQRLPATEPGGLDQLLPHRIRDEWPAQRAGSAAL